MRGATMTTERLLQVFLSPNLTGVFEVSIDAISRNLTCSCPGYRARYRCKHLRWVESQLSADGGFHVPVPAETDMEALVEASHDAITWREFVLRTFKPEVL